MQPAGPYRFTHVLGGSPVGKAWAAIDEQGRLVTVAVLDATVAAAPGWREAFVGMTNSLAQAADPLPYAYADFSAAAPWVAYSAEVGPGAEKLLRALGVEYTPDPAAARPVSGVPQPVSGMPQPVSGLPQPVSGVAHPVSGVPQSISGPPHLPWAVQAGPNPTRPVPSNPHPAPGPPAPGWDAPTTAMPAQPVAETPQSPAAAQAPAPAGVPPYDPLAAPARRITPSETRRRRTGLRVGIVALVLVLLGGAGAFAWVGLRDTTEQPTANPSPTGVVQSGTPEWSPSARPQQPGIEPPRPGDWPKWQVFGRSDAVRTLTPDGLGFDFVAPADWTCTPGGSNEGQVKYNCGASIGDNAEIGGELIVRNCPECGEEQRDALRKAEEAWGLQWRSGGPYVVLAETVKLNGANKYGVVVVAFWRSEPDGAIDRQLVLRMTAPEDWIDVIRRVVNSIRDNAGF